MSIKISHRFVVLVACVSLSMLPVEAQMPVFDAPHILETIYNGYQMYQSVQNSLKNLEYAYQTTQAQLKQLQQLRIDDIASFQDAVSFVDAQVDFVRQTENRFKSIGVNVGGKNVPLTQFYRVPFEAYNMVKDDMTANMSDWEKARAWSHYGLNPANYFYMKAMGTRLHEAQKQMAVIGDVIKQNQEKTAEKVEGLMAAAEETESSLAVLQSLTAMMQIMIGEQMEANRLNGLALQHQADKEIAADLPAPLRGNSGRVSRDWLE